MSDDEKQNLTIEQRADQVREMSGQSLPPDIEFAETAPKFQEWIDSFEHDARSFLELLEDEEVPPELRF